MTSTGLKILVIRFSSIGDIVLTTPIVRGLKLQLGGELHYLTKNSFQNLLISNPHIDKVFSIKKSVTEVLPQLKEEQYDYIIDLHKNLRSQQIRWALKAKYLSFDKINFEKWLMVNFKRDRLPKEHIVMRYMKAVEGLGVKYDEGGLDYFFGEESGGNGNLPSGLKPPNPLKGETRVPTNLLSDLPSNLEANIGKNIFEKIIKKTKGTSDGKLAGTLVSPFRGVGGFNPDGNLEKGSSKKTGKSTYIAFAIGGAHATKRLPKEKIISICKKIKRPIILLGGKDDATIGEEIVLTINKSKPVLNISIFNACGKLTLDESAWVVKGAQKVITHDTGMMHIAAAFQKEIVSIWGNTIPGFGMYPFYKKGVNLNTSIQVHDLSCRPCSKIGFEKCPKGHFKCMQDIDEKKIEKAINT